MTRSPASASRCLVVCLALFLPESGFAKSELSFHPPPLQALDIAALSRIVESETGISLVPDPSISPGDDPLDSVLDGSADLAIVDNTRPFSDGVRTVIPLYRGVVHIAIRADLEFDDIRAGRARARVEVINDSHAGRRVLDLLFERLGDGAGRYELWSPGDAGLPDLLVYVGPVNPGHVTWFREGFRLLQVGRSADAGSEFYIEGINYLVPQLQPTHIPAHTYALPGNESGIDALAVDMLLVTRADARDDAIYALTKTLVEQKPRFVASEPALFRWLSMDFSDENLAYPLHRGARAYVHRDEPGFLERYAETLNFLVYLAALMVTGILGLGRWRARRRKDRIDAFYLRVRELRSALALSDPETCLLTLEQIEDEAFTALIAERLAADESFRIFMDLAESLRRELRELQR